MKEAKTSRISIELYVEEFCDIDLYFIEIIISLNLEDKDT